MAWQKPMMYEKLPRIMAVHLSWYVSFAGIHPARPKESTESRGGGPLSTHGSLWPTIELGNGICH